MGSRPRWTAMNWTVSALVVLGLLALMGEARPALGQARAAAPARPVNFTCTVDGQALSTSAGQFFGIGRGNALFLMPDRDLLLYGNAEGSTSTMPSAGFRQRILDVGADEPLSIVLTLGSAFPNDPRKILQVTLAVRGLTKKILTGGLPLTARVGTRSGPALDAMVQSGAVTYPNAASGHMVIEAVDLTQRTIKGSFEATTSPGMIGQEKPLTITAGRFDLR